MRAHYGGSKIKVSIHLWKRPVGTIIILAHFS
jgi:hypothetical protein